MLSKCFFTMGVFACLGFFVSVGTAHAATKTLTWDPVTTCTDGSPCTPSTYTLYRNTNGGPFAVIGTTSAPVVSTTDPAVPVGLICYDVTAKNAVNGESAHSSPPVCLQQPAPTLAAPTNLR
jgi:hypothetical protein